jgi:hypothetical protein
MEKKKLITWICDECGDKYCRRPASVATWHEDICDICGRKRAVTEPRDFGGLSSKHKELIIRMLKAKSKLTTK